MTAEETVSILKIAIAEVEWNYPLDYAIAIETAIQALEKQIPKKLVRENSMWGICPTCNRFAEIHQFVQPKHCEHCGQALDWSEENAET